MNLKQQYSSELSDNKQGRGGHFVLRENFVQRESASFVQPNYQKSDGEIQKNEKRGIVKFLDKLITLCLGALFFGVPIFFSSQTLQGIIFEKQIYFYFWILLALVAWVSKGVIIGEMKIRRTPLDIPIVLLVISYLISMFSSIDRWHSVWGFFGDPSRGLVNIMALVIAYFLILSHFDKNKITFLITCLVWVSCFLIIYFAFNLFGINLPERVSQYFPLSPLGSLTAAGIFLAAMIPIMLSSALSVFTNENGGKSIWKKVNFIFLFFILTLDLFILFALYSFVSWLGVLIGVSFFLIFILAQIVRPSENSAWLPMIVFLFVVFVLLVGDRSISKVSLPLELSPSNNLSWTIAKDSLKDNFLIGSGPATYAYNFALYKSLDFNQNSFYSVRFFHGSNIIFESLPTVGVIGAFALMLIILTFLSVGLYLLSINKKKNKIYSLGAFSSALIILISALTGKIDGSIVIISVLVGALALGTLLFESETEQTFFTLSLKASPKYALSLAFIFLIVSSGVIFLFVFIGRLYVADTLAAKAMRQQKISIDGSVDSLVKAVNLNRNESKYYVLLGQQLISMANEETLKGEKNRNLELIQDYLNKSITAVNKARNIAPNDVSVIESLGQIYENSGLYVSDSFDLAEDNYRKSLELEPNNPIFLEKIGQIKLAKAGINKDPEDSKKIIGDARDSFQKAIEKKNNLATAHYQLALTQEALGDLDGAVVSIENANKYGQNNLNYVYNAARIYQNRGKENDVKIAEAIYKKIISINDKEINSHFGLGMLYEKTQRREQAREEYGKVLQLLPQENQQVREKIQKMVDNIAIGIENKPENLQVEKENSEVNDTEPVLNVTPEQENSQIQPVTNVGE